MLTNLFQPGRVETVGRSSLGEVDRRNLSIREQHSLLEQPGGLPVPVLVDELRDSQPVVFLLGVAADLIVGLLAGAVVGSAEMRGGVVDEVRAQMRAQVGPELARRRLPSLVI